MKIVRRLHLFLGCFFAPLLAFFSISGFWQTLQIQWKPQNHFLLMLTSLHTGRGTMDKTPDLSSPVFHYVVLVMAVSLLLSIALGVIMALSLPSRRMSMFALTLGVLIPLLVVLFR